MKSAVVFASKHSTTADIAHRIARDLAGAQPEDRQVAHRETGQQVPGAQAPGRQRPTAQSPGERAPGSQAPEHQDVVVLDLADGTPDLTPFDLVVLGTPIYAGQPLPAMKELLRAGIPHTARLGLFVIGMVPDADGRERELANAYPEELRARARATGFLGGRLRLSRMSRFERFVVTRMAKTSTDVDAIDEEALSRFVTELRG
jgi:Flavodoxin